MDIEAFLSHKTCQKLAQAQPVGEGWPYDGGSEAEILAHIKGTIATLAQRTGLALEPEFDHYGSGYASYVDIFARRRDDSGATQRSGHLEITGLRVYLSRLAPIACMGKAMISRGPTFGSFSYLEPSQLGTTPGDAWNDVARAMRGALSERGYALLPAALAARALPFDVEIPTVLSDGPFRYFDAVFFWED